MDMKVNKNYISIPPYLSVSWKEVASLAMKEDTLYLSLKNGEVIVLPELETAEVDNIFLCHLQYMEQDSARMPMPFGRMSMGDSIPFDPSDLADMPIAFKIGTPDGVVSAMAHNPIQSENPDLPPELLDKIIGVTKMMGMPLTDQLPEGVLGCNCFFCQIMTHLHHENFLKEEVSMQDLQFEDWKVNQTGDKLFSVENPLDSSEKHSVYLGHPLKCSCGHEGCEHIIAVLKS